MNATLSPVAVTTLFDALAPKPTAFNISTAARERAVSKALAAELNTLTQRMLKLPASQRNAFVSSAPEHHRAMLTVKSVESLIVYRKAATATYSNKYGHKSAPAAQPAPTTRNEQRESLSFKQLQVAKKSTAKPQPINAATYINPVMQNNMLVPAGYTPVVPVAVDVAPDKYAVATEKILGGKPAKKATGFGGKAMASLNKSHSKGEKPSDRYGELMRESAGAAGL